MDSAGIYGPFCRPINRASPHTHARTDAKSQANALPLKQASKSKRRPRRHSLSLDHQGASHVRSSAGVHGGSREPRAAQESGPRSATSPQRREQRLGERADRSRRRAVSGGKWKMASEAAQESQHPCAAAAAVEQQLSVHASLGPQVPAGSELLADLGNVAGLGVQLVSWGGEAGDEGLRGDITTLQGGRCGPMRILLIDNHDSYTYNLYHLIAPCNYGVPPLVLRNDALPWHTVEPLLQQRCPASPLPRAELRDWLTANGIEFPGEDPLPHGQSSAGPGSNPDKLDHSYPSASPFFFDCVIISPGPGSPSIPSDIGVCMDVLRTCGHIPIFGVCMGHQALGVARGGTVGLAPHPVHGQLSPVEHSGHQLLSGIPSGAGFEVVRYHSLVVDPGTLPPELEAIGWASDEGILSPTVSSSAVRHRAEVGVHLNSSTCIDGGRIEGSSSSGGSTSPSPSDEMIVMALAHKQLPHYGVQFHPESIETKHGHKLLSNFLDLAAAFWMAEGGSDAALQLKGEAASRSLRRARAVMGPFQLEVPAYLKGLLEEWTLATAPSSPCPLLSPPQPCEGTLLHPPEPEGHHLCTHPTVTHQSSLHQDPLPSHSHQAASNLLLQTKRADSSLSLHWGVVHGALGLIPGGAAGLFSMVFGAEEARAQDTFWLDSSTAEPIAREGDNTADGRSAPSLDGRGHGQAPNACWSTGTAAEQTPLDSTGADRRSGFGSAPLQPRPRFSFMGGVGGPLWRKLCYHLPAHQEPRADEGREAGVGFLQVEDCEGVLHMHTAEGTGLFEHLEQELERWTLAQQQCRDLPFDFCGGFVGYLGYELKAECGAAPSKHGSSHPDAFFFRVDRFLALDHSTGDVYVVGASDSCTDQKRDGAGAAQCSPAEGRQCCAESEGDQPVQEGRECRTPLWREHQHGKERRSTAQWVRAFVEDLQRNLRRASSKAARPGDRGSESEQQQQILERLRCSSDSGSSSGGPRLQPRKQQAEYEAAVRECQGHILLGESYELCLTTQLEGTTHPPACRALESSAAGKGEKAAARAHGSRPEDALQFYMKLREVSPAPYGAWLYGAFRRPGSSQLGSGVEEGAGDKEAVILCCSSPERFLRLDSAGVLEAKPIKGTRPRGATLEEDQQLADSLRTNVKDRAENLMIVDLLRNDLGRVSTIGSVRVPSLMAIESYAFVHQLVSTVQSNLHPSISPVAAIRAAFPGGSMTGAPKIRSMQLLDEIECSARGPYSGALGYFSFNRTFSFNIIIRTAVLGKDTISVGAGGAVIALSDPTSEYKEMLLKSRSVARALTSL